MRFSLVVFALLLVSASIFAQAPDKSDVRPFTEFTGKGVEGQDYEFTVSGYKYTILSNGRGKREAEKGAVRRFNLRLSGVHLDGEIYYADYRGDVLLICETSDSEGGSGFITRLDGKTLAMKWKRSIRGFNVGQGLLEGNHAYVMATGFVGKVNLETGAYVWKHDNLYRSDTGRYGDQDFNSFELPKIDDDAVLFTERETHPNPPQTLKIHKRTGKLITE
ncbi:MAG TPA: hypothetical protein VFM63_01860 [Pyrinomonadaceae bacterium]|nr:hypothetical protein [Pyrinomonadaceae bacterium]